jgi:hypothetical protein
VKALGFHNNANGSAIDFAIKAITRSQYSHVAMLIDDPVWRETVRESCKLGAGDNVIIEALFPRVRARTLNDSELPNIDVFDVPTHTTAQHDKSMQWLLKQVGLAYDSEDLLRFLPNFRAFMGEGSDTSYLKHTFCSMMAYNYYRFGDTCLFRCVHDYEVAPGYLFSSPMFTPLPALQPSNPPNTGTLLPTK